MEDQKPPVLEDVRPSNTARQVNIGAMLTNPSITKFYANGFVGGRTQTDIFAISMNNGTPQFVVNMSFNTAKNLHNFLSTVIRDIEKALEQEIKSLPAVK